MTKRFYPRCRVLERSSGKLLTDRRRRSLQVKLFLREEVPGWQKGVPPWDKTGSSLKSSPPRTEQDLARKIRGFVDKLFAESPGQDAGTQALPVEISAKQQPLSPTVQIEQM